MPESLGPSTNNPTARSFFRVLCTSRPSLKPSLFACLAIRTFTMTAIAIPTFGAQWQPPAEPKQWQEVRETLESKGLISPTNWIFFGALENATTQAAEYLSNLQPKQDAVVFDGLLLLKRSPDAKWVLRPLVMRAICTEGRLERRNANGEWADYSGRAGTADKVEWLCRQKL